MAYFRNHNYLFIFFLIRLYHLGCHDLWYDEIGTVSYAQYPWGNWNAPLYWILMHYWIKVFGISEFSLRFPSLIFSFLSVVLLYFLGKNLFNKKVGIISSFLLGLSPFHIWYAQEARDYSMVLFFGSLSSWLFYKALKENKLKLWSFFILASIISLYTNYFYIFLFLAQFIYLLFSKNRKINFKSTICFSMVAFSFHFYLSHFLSKFYYIAGGFWIPKPKWESLLITLENFILGYNGFPFLYYISDILMGLFFISALVIVYKKPKLRKSFTFCIFLFVIPIACAFFFSKAFFSVYLDRGLIIFSPYFYLILSLGIVFLSRVTRAVLSVILIITLSIADYGYFKDWMFMPLEHHTGTHIKKSIKPIAKFLDDNIQLQDIVAFTNESVMPSLNFYSQKTSLPFYYYFFDPRFPDSSWQRPLQESKYCVPFYKINQLEFKRLWVISSDWARSGELDKNSQSIKNWLDRNYKLEFVNLFDGLWVFRYVKKRT